MQLIYTGMVLDGDNRGLYHFGMGLLSKLRELSGLSQSALASLARTSQPQITRLENNDRKLTREWAVRLAPHLGILPEELLFGGRTVPIVGYVGAASEAHYYADSQGNLGHAQFPRGGTERTVAVETRGDSLGAAFDGWIIYYDQRRDPPTDDLLGALCVVGLHSGQVLVKTLMRGRLPGHYDLFPGASGTVLTDQAVEWAARVTALMPPSAKVEMIDQRESPPTPQPKARKSAGKKRKN